MWKILFKSILFILFSSGNGKEAHKLTGGEYIHVRLHSFHVSVHFLNQHLCSGNIVNELHVLTTSSCVLLDGTTIFYGNLEILAGTHDMSSNIGKKYQVQHLIPHPDYKPTEFWANDIAILRLSKIMRLHFQYIGVALSSAMTEFRHERLEMIGWEGPQRNNKVMSKLKIIPLSRLKCFQAYGRSHESQGCVLLKTASASFTNGDSGNLLITPQKQKVVGIISLVPNEENSPAIYTRVTWYVNWIREIAGKTS